MDAINPQSHYPLLKYSIKLIQKKRGAKEAFT